MLYVDMTLPKKIFRYNIVSIIIIGWLIDYRVVPKNFLRFLPNFPEELIFLDWKVFGIFPRNLRKVLFGI